MMSKYGRFRLEIIPVYRKYKNKIWLEKDNCVKLSLQFAFQQPSFPDLPPMIKTSNRDCLELVSGFCLLRITQLSSSTCR